MICPFCLSDHTEVYNSRLTGNQHRVWRRRRCLECRRSFTTYEQVDLGFLQINGQPYSRAKLYQSLLPCFGSQAEQLKLADACVTTVEMKLVREPDSALSADRLVTLVLQTLKPLSPPALLRYLAATRPEMNNQALQAVIRQL